jgi:hypothetical protein
LPDPDSAGGLPRVAELLETYFVHACALLRQGSSRNRMVRRARACLRDRGVQSKQLDRLRLGVLPEAADLEQVLREAGFLPEEIEASKLLADARLPGRLIAPIRDFQGHIISFWARHPGGQSPKYLIKGKWKDELSVFGLDVALPAIAQTQGPLVLIGDLLDAVLLHGHGFLPMAAIGGPGFQMTSQRWQRLAELGVSQVVLVLSGPTAHEELLAALGAAFDAQRSPQVYVVPPDRFPETESLAAWAHRHECDAFAAAVGSEPIHGRRYQALALLSAHRTGDEWTDATRYATLEAARLFYRDQARRGGREDLDAHFVPCIVEGLQLDWDAQRPVEEPPVQVATAAVEPEEPPPIAEPEEPPAVEPPRRQRPTDYCPLHRCSVTECFCFD